VILCLRIFVLDAEKNRRVSFKVGHDDRCINVAKD
jgi:hypothetical protein